MFLPNGAASRVIYRHAGAFETGVRVIREHALGYFQTTDDDGPNEPESAGGAFQLRSD